MASKDDMEMRWLAGQETKRRRGTASRAPIPPWDEMVYFDKPFTHSVPIPFNSGALLIASQNPHRVALIVSCVLAGTAFISPTAEPTNGLGIPIANTLPPVIITQREHGNLCQCEWFVTSSNQVTIYVIEVLLREWQLP